MKRSVGVGFALAILLVTAKALPAPPWAMQPVTIQTRWGASVDPSNVLPEYPRPQLVRPHWQNLNGLWDYAITAEGARRPERYDGKILVPYPLESALSGVQKPLRPDQLLWYRRMVARPSFKPGERVLLHFGAVDYAATVYLNGGEVGAHSGGYQSFTFDITQRLRDGGNELVLKVLDPTSTGINPHGKQTLHPQRITYTASSGIWQTVWLEVVPETYIESLSLTPHVEEGELQIQVNVHGGRTGDTIQATALSGSSVIAEQALTGRSALRISHPHLWSPDDPFLYDLRVRVLREGRAVDEVKSYFGMRTIEVKRDADGVERIFLNGRSVYNLGVLDQGFWPEGLYTAPSDAALSFDVQAVKAMGFNTIRKHVKVEPDRWYYHCDRLGVLVWQDMVPPANRTPAARAEFEAEVQPTLSQLHNHPSITTWVLFNEGWGSYDPGPLAKWIREVDGSRLIDSHSGPYDSRELAQWIKRLDPARLGKLLTGEAAPDVKPPRDNRPGNWPGGDVTDIHAYPEPEMPPKLPGKARVVGEWGGLGVLVGDHVWNDLDPGWGYLQLSSDRMGSTYAGMIDRLKVLEGQGLSGSIYTQLVDVEGERNGLLTYDRAVIKFPLSEIRALNGQLVPRAGNDAGSDAGGQLAVANAIPESQRYAALIRDYDRGQRNLAFLKHFALTAHRQGDLRRATAAGNELIQRLLPALSSQDWAVIYAVTATSQDTGFQLMRARSAEVNSALGKQAAEIKIREIIGREELAPYRERTAAGWAALEKKLIVQYGVLGAEAVYGAEMIHYLERGDWRAFGQSYIRYFSTAAERSEYPINNLSYVLFQHVTDREAIEAAVETLGRSIAAGGGLLESLGETDPTELDTYANLLYKAGRAQEAVEWESRAVQLTDNRDPEMVEHLRKMKSKQPTWLDGGPETGSSRTPGQVGAELPPGGVRPQALSRSSRSP